MRFAIAAALAFLALPGAARPDAAAVTVAVVDSGVNPSVPGLVTGHNAVDGSSDTAERRPRDRRRAGRGRDLRQVPDHAGAYRRREGRRARAWSPPESGGRRSTARA
jgi:hypothetical protein